MAPIWMMLLMVATVSCSPADKEREKVAELQRAIEEFRQGYLDGLGDSTVIVSIGDSLTAVKGGFASSSYAYTYTSRSDSTAGAGTTYINVTMPQQNNDWSGFDVPDFLPSAVVVGTIMVFGMPVLAIFLICYFMYRTKRARYQSIARIMEAGREVPPGMFPQMEPHAKWDSGVRYVAWGAGLMLFFVVCQEIEWAMLMLVPIIIGVGKLIAYRKERRAPRPADPAEPEQPASEPSCNIPPIPPRR